jgi:hypothetical protein
MVPVIFILLLFKLDEKTEYIRVAKNIFATEIKG